MKIFFILTNEEYRQRCQHVGRCQWAIHEGLKALGHDLQIEVPANGKHAIKTEPPRALFLWNGVKNYRAGIVEATRDAGGVAYIMERGFFDRFAYTQVDHLGFSHRSSWAEHLCESVHIDGRLRFETAWGRPVAPMEARDSGYILILGQTNGDSQLDDSEMDHPKTLIGAVQKVLPAGVPLRFRPHPHYSWRCRGMRAEPCEAATLEEAVAGARFVITINSNAGSEALAMGCPVLCFGPALYAMGHVAIQTSRKTLEADLLTMLAGACPPQGEVENYLYHLACHQYGLDELRRGDCLRRIMEN